MTSNQKAVIEFLLRKNSLSLTVLGEIAITVKVNGKNLSQLSFSDANRIIHYLLKHYR